MQVRYLGDSHDYLKFALLRHLQRSLDLTIGVNWYLTCPENNGDGEQRGYLNNLEWKCLDKELLEKLRPFRKREYRTLENFERDGILPRETLYYKSNVAAKNERSKWHEQAVCALSKADLIFLDQDNGFEVKTMTGRTQAKYAFYREALDYYERGKIVIAIQFAAMIKPIERVKEVRGQLLQSGGCSKILPVVRGRVTPNILFFTIAPLDRFKAVEEALRSFPTENPVFKKLQQRVQLIV